MKVRYTKDKQGKLIKQADIYQLADHGITVGKLDQDAVKVAERLNARGYEAYIVGGAVRDLLLGIIPKDYDMATDAKPSQIKRIFRNSRIIGKRFRLVHLFYPDGKILEVVTFRSSESGNHNNLYGKIEEDVFRRDFTLNALYYSPKEEEIIDFVGGVKDIRKGMVRCVVPLKMTFQEDPVRMLRAVKYSVSSKGRIPFRLAFKIKMSANLLKDCSISRLSEELFKILQSGRSAAIFKELIRFKLISYLIPNISKMMDESKDFKNRFFDDMLKLEAVVARGDSKRSKMIRFLVEGALEEAGIFKKRDFSLTIRKIKDLISPLIAPNKEIDEAVRAMFRKRKIRFSNKRSYRPSAARKRGKPTG